MEACLLIMLCVLIVPLWDYFQEARAPEFDDYRDRLAAMPPAQRAAAIGDLRDSARKSLHPPRFVRPDGRAMRETCRRKERLALQLARHFEVQPD